MKVRTPASKPEEIDKIGMMKMPMRKPAIMKPETQESLGDLEYEAEVRPEFISPIGILGLDAKKTTIAFEPDPFGYQGFYRPRDDMMSITDVTDKGLDAYDKYGTEKIDRKQYRAMKENPTIEHEAIHRGLQILADYYDYDEIAERFDVETANFLFENATKRGRLASEVITELNDARRLGLKDYETFVNRFRNRTTLGGGDDELKLFMAKNLAYLPAMEELARERLYDRNPKGGPTRDARGLAKGSLDKNFYKDKRVKKNILSDFVGNIRQKFKDFVTKKPDFEETSKQMPKEFQKGGDVTTEEIPNYEKMFQINTATFDDIGEQIVIDFKDGQYLLLRDAEKMISDSRTAEEPVTGKNTAKKVLKFLKEKNPTKEEFIKHFTSKGLNRGGATVERQMEMAFMQEGGLRDDGMDRDPVSGNEVPSGSLAEEVRDDIPAQLSEGEYVVPADVVRFFGIKFFEDLRMQAKMGLAQMEDAGRIGGEPIEEDAEMLDPEDEMKIREMVKGFQGGGVSTDEDFEKDAEAKKFDFGKYSTPGGTLFGPRKPRLEGLVTYYHPDGREENVLYVNGETVNEEQVQFTKAPWSTTKPSVSTPSTGTGGVSTGFESQEESSNRERDLGGVPTTTPDESLSTEDLARKYDGQALYFDAKKNRAVKMPELVYKNLQREYNKLGGAAVFDSKEGAGDGFGRYYRLPQSDKMSLLFENMFGEKPSATEINDLLEKSQTDISFIDAIKNGGLVGLFMKLGKDKNKKIVSAPVKEKPRTALEDLAAGNVRNQFLEKTDKGEPTGRIDPDKYFAEIGKGTPLGTTRVDKFLLGVDKNTTPEQLARIEKNRQDVQRDAFKNFQKEAAKITGDPIRRAEEESQSPGDLDTVAEVKAFEDQMREAQKVARGFEKGGLASKTKAKPKRKKNTKGLGTKPKAT